MWALVIVCLAAMVALLLENAALNDQVRSLVRERDAARWAARQAARAARPPR